MDFVSLGLRTHMMLAAHSSHILERDDHVVVHTPDNPSFHWGNCLYFARPPRVDDCVRWLELFDEAITRVQPTVHLAIGWDGVEAEVGDARIFEVAGCTVEHSVTLATGALERPERYLDALDVRILDSDSDWQDAVDVQIECRDPVYSAKSYRVFKTAQFDSYRRMCDAGLGHWFGGFLDGRQVANLGVFAEGGLGRYQVVGTHPDARRQGVARTLVYEAGAYMRRSRGLEHLVIVTEPDSSAQGMYESMGFAPRELTSELYWYGGESPEHARERLVERVAEEVERARERP